jgi:hypothetical protein
MRKLGLREFSSTLSGTGELSPGGFIREKEKQRRCSKISGIVRQPAVFLVEVPGGPTSRLAPSLPLPCWCTAWGWLQLADLDGRVSAETLLELLHQGLHCLLCCFGCCYRVAMGLRLGLGSPLAPGRLDLATLSLWNSLPDPLKKQTHKTWSKQRYNVSCIPYILCSTLCPRLLGYGRETLDIFLVVVSLVAHNSRQFQHCETLLW